MKRPFRLPMDPSPISQGVEIVILQQLLQVKMVLSPCLLIQEPSRIPVAMRIRNLLSFHSRVIQKQLRVKSMEA